MGEYMGLQSVRAEQFDAADRCDSAGQWRIYDRCDPAGKLQSLPEPKGRRYVITQSLPQCRNVLTLYSVAGDVQPIFSVLFSFFMFDFCIVWFGLHYCRCLEKRYNDKPNAFAFYL